jgi:hypothetical protein
MDLLVCLRDVTPSAFGVPAHARDVTSNAYGRLSRTRGIESSQWMTVFASPESFASPEGFASPGNAVVVR